MRAVLTGEPEDDAVYSWSMTSRYVWGGVEEPGPALSALVNEMLTDSNTKRQTVKNMLEQLKKEIPDLNPRIMSAIQNKNQMRLWF